MELHGVYGLIGVIICLLLLSMPMIILLSIDYIRDKKKEKTLVIKYDIYIIGEPSGEIFYVDKKRINKLKEANLIKWSNDIGKYIFKDDKVEDVIKLISPMIVNYFSNNVINESDLIDRTPF